MAWRARRVAPATKLIWGGPGAPSSPWPPSPFASSPRPWFPLAGLDLFAQAENDSTTNNNTTTNNNNLSLPAALHHFLHQCTSTYTFLPHVLSCTVSLTSPPSVATDAPSTPSSAPAVTPVPQPVVAPVTVYRGPLGPLPSSLARVPTAPSRAYTAYLSRRGYVYTVYSEIRAAFERSNPGMSRNTLGLPPSLLHWSLAPTTLPPPPPRPSLLPPWAGEYDWVADGVFNYPMFQFSHVTLPPSPPTPPVLPWPPGCSGCLSIRWGHVCVCLSALSPNLADGASYLYAATHMPLLSPVADLHALRDQARRTARRRKAVLASAALCAPFPIGVAGGRAPTFCGPVPPVTLTPASLSRVCAAPSPQASPPCIPINNSTTPNSTINSNLNLNPLPVLVSCWRVPARWVAGRRRAISVRPPLVDFLSVCYLGVLLLITSMSRWRSMFSPSCLPPPRGVGWVPAEWLLPFDSVGLG